MHQRGRDERGAKRNNETAKERAPLIVEHVQQRTHRRRIARELEEAHHPEHQDDPQIAGEDHGEPERQHRNEIDDACRTQRIFQTRAHGRQMLVRPVLDRGPQPQHVFERENQQREKLNGRKGGPVMRFVFRNGFQRDRDQIDQNQNDKKSIDGRTDTITNRALFKDVINTPAQILETVACHAVATPVSNTTLTSSLRRPGPTRRMFKPPVLPQSPSTRRLLWSRQARRLAPCQDGRRPLSRQALRLPF